MPRSIWKGSISFGLVNIPVAIYPAEEQEELSFRLLDKRDLTPIRYKRVNGDSGEEVPKEEIVRGFEYEPSHYVLLSDAELKKANPEATETIEILDFVNIDEVDPSYFVKPYFLGPVGRAAPKAYAVLREAMRKSGRVAIAKVVMRSREYLTALIPRGPMLVLEVLRWANELRSSEGITVPAESLEAAGVSEKEVQMAELLLEGMVGKWEPEQYHDTYRDDVMKLIDEKVAAGNSHKLDEAEADAKPQRAEVIDLMELLKKSLANTETAKPEEPKKPGRREKAG